MRILQISDTHQGITTRRAIITMLAGVRKKDFDVIVYCGDYSGGRVGAEMVLKTVDIIRAHFPKKPFVSVLGNHDYWVYKKNGRPSLKAYESNYNKICAHFKENNIHFLDEDGFFQLKKFSDVIITGNSGWYLSLNPPTNDGIYMPRAIEGNTHRWMEKRARGKLFEQLDSVDKFYDKKKHSVVFVSHFPVIKGPDKKGRFEDFSWDANIGDMIQEDYGCKYFLNGHAHQKHHGPLRYETGSDYYNPKCQIITV